MLTLGDWRGGGWRLQGQGRGEGGEGWRFTWLEMWMGMDDGKDGDGQQAERGWITEDGDGQSKGRQRWRTSDGHCLQKTFPMVLPTLGTIG